MFVFASRLHGCEGITRKTLFPPRRQGETESQGPPDGETVDIAVVF